MWQTCFDKNRLDDIICHGLKEQMDPLSFKTFSTIAYQCLKKAREERPTMAKIMQQLEIALKVQLFEDLGKSMNFEKMKKIAYRATYTLTYISQSHLLLLFLKGILVDDGKTWFWVNKKGEHCELISAERCISKYERLYLEPITRPVSRFQFLFRHLSTPYWRLTVETQFLSPHVTYVVNLVYDYGKRDIPNLRIPFKYKWNATIQYSTSCVGYLGKDGWRRTELFQFTSTKNDYYFDIEFLREKKSQQYDQDPPSIEGIEFCPLDLTDKKLEEKNKVDNQLVTNSDINWGKKLPNGYSEILEWSEDTYHSLMTKKEVYFLLRKGLHLKDPQEWSSMGEWFSINKNSKKCHMLSARCILQEESLGWNFLSRRVSWVWKSLPGSRFGEVAETCDKNHLAFSLQIKPQLLSPGTIYACYLVYKLPENYLHVREHCSNTF
ncbi:putative phloem protein [Helianthus annuus]|nr:putative phloem protein [Helianthus annuus]